MWSRSEGVCGEGRGSLQPPIWPRVVFLPLLHVSGARRTPEPPLRALWLQSQETDFEIGATRAPAEGGGAGGPHRAPSPRSALQGEAESQGASVSCWSAAGGVTVSLFSLTPAGCPYYFPVDRAIIPRSCPTNGVREGQGSELAEARCRPGPPR